MEEVANRRQLDPLLDSHQRQQLALVEFLYHRSPSGSLITLLVGVVLTVVVWIDIGGPWPWAWLALLSVTILLRVGLYLAYLGARVHPELIDHDRWRRLFIGGAVLTAVLLGAGAVMVYPWVDDHTRLMVQLLLVGMAAGAVQYLGPWLPAFLAYMVAIMGPLTVYLLSGLQPQDLAVAGLYLLMMAAFAVGVHHGNRLLLQSLYFRFENERLAHDLEGSVDTLSNTNRALQELSTTDELTGMVNRRGFRQRYGLEWRVHQRESVPLALIMIDVDFFKNYNDAYGHIAGDTTLIRIGQVIATCLKRPGDMAARFGGEEFILLLPRTDTEGARQVAEKIRRTVAERDIEHAHSPVAPRVTVSMGIVSVIPHAGMERAQLIEYADQALYEAKEQGRDRWVIKAIEGAPDEAAG